MPKFVLAFAAVVAPVPPLLIGTVPEIYPLSFVNSDVLVGTVILTTREESGVRAVPFFFTLSLFSFLTVAKQDEFPYQHLHRLCSLMT